MSLEPYFVLSTCIQEEPGLYDQSGLYRRAGGDPQLVAEIIDLFLVEAPRLLERIRGGLLRQDERDLPRAVHSLKGTVSCLAESELIASISRLEAAVNAGDGVQADSVLTLVARQMDRLIRAISEARRP